MKITLFAVLGAGLLITTALFAADQGNMHEKMHEMMMQQGGPMPDTRTELKLPEPMKVMQKRMMREHMATLSEITAALATNDLNRAAEVAKSKLGWNPAEEKRCSTIEQVTGEKDFLGYGKAVHMKADELSEAAKAGKRDIALATLSELINNCNACHNRFRH